MQNMSITVAKKTSIDKRLVGVLQWWLFRQRLRRDFGQAGAQPDAGNYSVSL